MSHAVADRFVGQTGYGRRSIVHRGQAIDERTQPMRRIGLAMCVASAAVTLASATWIAIRF